MFDFGMLGGLAETGGGILDTIMGSNQQDKALKLAKKQYKLMKKLALAGYNSGRGLRTYWNPDAGPTGEGEWTTDYTGTAQLMQDASEEAEIRRLMQEEPRLAQERYANYMSRQKMRPIIDSLTNRLAARQDITPGALEGLLNQISGASLKDVYGRAENAIARQGLRTPGSFGSSTSTTGGMLKDLAESEAEARAKNKLTALTGAEDLNTQGRGNLINQINALSPTAMNFDDVPFSPAQMDIKGLNLSAGAGNKALSAFGGAGGNYLNATAGQPSPWGDILGGVNSLLNMDWGSTTGDTQGNKYKGLGGKSSAQHNEFLRNVNYDRAF